MKKARLALQSRTRLDERLKEMGPLSPFAPPVRGWIKAIREALGMSSAQLAKRLGVKQPSVVNMEQSEARGSIELATLRRVAEALDCTLVYALVPNKPLETVVRERARGVVRKRLAAVAHSMQLEDQTVGARETEAQIDEMVRNITPSRLWDEL
ncbi:MAG: mobile mystery protein A [Bryobacteraceae bacterium]|jgi:predicted DNA-binding mobile mystery protein A